MAPQKVAEQAQNLSLPARIALPAIIAHNMNQERTLAVYSDQPPRDSSTTAPGPQPAAGDSIILKRLNPKNGRVMWTHEEERAPLDMEFDQNTLRLVFRREVEALRFLVP
jgi:hypothetical protein